MKNIIQNFISILAIFFLMAAINVGPMEKAMKAALKGPQKKKLKIFDHEFNVKPIEISREGTRIIVNGHISHHLGWGQPDDQVYYTIVKEGDKIIEIKKKINYKGPESLVAPIVSVVGAYFGVPITSDKVETVGKDIRSVVDGTWEGACDAIIANVALRVK